jgi:hypothetical protein
MPLTPFVAYLCFDPRDPAQRLENRDTWKRTTNGILIAATMLYNSQESFPMSWDKVAALADLSEELDDEDAEPVRTATIEQTNRMLHIALAKRETGFA